MGGGRPARPDASATFVGQSVVAQQIVVYIVATATPAGSDQASVPPWCPSFASRHPYALAFTLAFALAFALALALVAA